MKHGVYVSEQATSVSNPVIAKSGIPFVIGTAPVQCAEVPAAPGVPILCRSWKEAEKALGYSEDWDKYSLCEFMYSHFTLFGCQPVIFCNLLDVATMKKAVAAEDIAVTNHKAILPLGTISDNALVVKAAGGTGTAYEKDVDYAVNYDGQSCIIEALSGGAIYTATSISVAYNAVDTTSITDIVVATGLEAIEKCMGVTGMVPDIICAPRYSDYPKAKAAMATKAASINGVFRAKALVDIGSDAGNGALTYTAAIEKKSTGAFTDENQIVCWPMAQFDGKKFHMSTLLAGLIAQVDTGNGGIPYESISNKSLKCDSIVLQDGTAVMLTLAEANELNASGIVTALNFMGDTVAWGNYTACYPGNKDVKDYMIPVSRMFDWVGNSLIYTFWAKLDKPMNRRYIDSIIDTVNIWMNGLVSGGYLLGGRVEYNESENPEESLRAGIVKVHIYMTPPSPAQEINFVLEYDVNYVTSALQG